MLVPTALIALVAGAAVQVACPVGMTSNEDTSGHCCWPNQAWSASRLVCVGIPICPAGMAAQGETCGCVAGMVVSVDTSGHCCWPDQAWSNARQRCVGLPSCPAGTQAQAETCIPAAVAPPPPAPAVTPPPPPTNVPETVPPAAGNPPPPIAAAAAPPPPAKTEKVVTVMKARTGLLVPGVALLGAFWLLTIVGTGTGQAMCQVDHAGATGICHTDEALAESVVPLIGPFLLYEDVDPYWRRMWRDAGPLPDVVKGLLVISGVVQIAGAGLIVTGALWRKPVEKRVDLGGFGETWVVSAGAGPQGGSFTFAMRF